MHKDFNLNVQLPKNRLCPTIPLRLNYILFIEDMLLHCGISDNVKGIDIGAGATAIYCLLAARMNKYWKMYGLEVDQENIQWARDNLSRNQLDDQVTIVDQNGSDKIFEKLFEKDQCQKTFCLCNPPFFSSKSEMLEGENRTGKRPKLQLEKPSHETITEGGELSFVTKILDESFELKDKIQIYSTMLGCKKNFDIFLSSLKERKIENYTTTTFTQGKVSRWAVAWSFSMDLKSFKDHLHKNTEKSATMLKHVIEGEEISRVVERIKEILANLKIDINVIAEHANKLYKWELRAQSNTWSNQRRKRRAEERNVELKVDTLSSEQNLTMGFEIIKGDEDKVVIQVYYISGSMSKDSVNQIFQFIKNKFNGQNQV